MEASARGDGARRGVPAFQVLGVNVNAVQIPDVVDIARGWIADGGGFRFVAVTGFHGVTEAHKDASFKRVLQEADLIVPDGMPLVWLGRREGFDLRRRVYGPELLQSFCRQTEDGYRHFFFGGAPGVAERLSEVLRDRYRIRVAGTLSPPFHPASPDEDAAMVEAINAARPDVLWVGLSTPKQERWMHVHRGALDVPVGIGVGAAFDFVSGAKRMAPAWMQERGLEWLFRLCSEPRRLWRRYLIGGSQFIYWLTLERLGLRGQR